MKVGLEANRYGHYVVSREDLPGYSTLYVQNDYDFPGLAANLGWSKVGVQKDEGVCLHRWTDGTVSCPDCGLTAAFFINCAAHWLDDHDGQVFDVDDDLFEFTKEEE